MQENKNNSPVNTPESFETKTPGKLPEEVKNLTEGELTEGKAVEKVAAVDSIIDQPAEQEELPVFKLHIGVELTEFVKAATPEEAKAKLLDLKLGARIKGNHNITLLEQIPYEQYKNFKVEIID